MVSLVAGSSWRCVGEHLKRQPEEKLLGWIRKVAGCSWTDGWGV